MSLRVLIGPDKFKGTLTASEAADAIAAGWRKARPNDDLDLLPITDGGDGFGQVLSDLWHAQPKTVHTVDAAHRPIRVRWWWDPCRKAAIIESAAIIGLAQLPPERFHPFELDTRGLAKAVTAAFKQGACRCIIGIGGSATNDAGFGIAQALGWQLLDRSGKPLERWIDLHKLHHLKPPTGAKSFPELIVAVDVQNPLIGKRGATRIYGPQKGLIPRDFRSAERALRKLAEVVRKDLGTDVANLAGAGAAGGLGFGLAVFLGASLIPGFDLFAGEADLISKVRRADLVITGEGRLDVSTMMGKGVGEVAKLCRRFKIPCIGLAGEVADPPKLNMFTCSFGLTDLTAAKRAKARPGSWLEKLTEKAAKEMSTNSQRSKENEG
jgi:glycerate kinase